MTEPVLVERSPPWRLGPRRPALRDIALIGLSAAGVAAAYLATSGAGAFATGVALALSTAS